ncbi:hypothetical protein NEOLEDRAFT_1181744 [Neolentinus lepideus HHB14362 ss-1]|uniref:MYND-type domain-containing protein n=1 Tax=Neolentinus lepideus HHB14362 ss-1 TaxID=1314782 RepID=A0A165PS01_9AGAM|nr:hypothetical protein NEOLEDRAFT_1181744 [Neolentinus lepideus HHB14362 ss-1]
MPTQAVNKGVQCAQCLKWGKRKDLFQCKGCLGASYCGKECQRAHWPVHRSLCKSNVDIKRQTDDIVLDVAETGRTASQIVMEMRRWAEKHQEVLSWGLTQSMQLFTNPSKGPYTIGLIYHLKYAPLDFFPHKIADLFQIESCEVADAATEPCVAEWVRTMRDRETVPFVAKYEVSQPVVFILECEGVALTKTNRFEGPGPDEHRLYVEDWADHVRRVVNGECESDSLFSLRDALRWGPGTPFDSATQYGVVKFGDLNRSGVVYMPGKIRSLKDQTEHGEFKFKTKSKDHVFLPWALARR